MTDRLRIVVTGLIAQHPRLAGVAWDYAQYPAGLLALGHDVYYVEDSGEWPYTVEGGPSADDWIARDCSENVEHLRDVMERFGLGERWAYRFPLTDRWYGLRDAKRERVLQSADLILNVSGTLERPWEYACAGRLAYIDSDPVFTQAKIVASDGDPEFRRRIDAHDVMFSFGEAFSARMPITSHDWLPTRQPVVLSEWRPNSDTRDTFTTVMSWTSYKPLRLGDLTLGQKDVELRRFLDLPTSVGGVHLEIAMGSTHHADWETATGGVNGRNPADVLADAGWRVVDADAVCATIDGYRSYVESSKAEWSVAKHGYVAGRPGWFSCRSACYLAAGRPVVVQDTGFGDVLPVGEGLLSFTTVDEAEDGIRAVIDDYARHAKAARAIAEEYFDSDKVLTDLVERAVATRRASGARAIAGAS